jgi:hypothetical protein
MSVTITNKSRQVLVIPLNSGSAVSLAPGETTAAIDEIETRANPKIEKMSNSGLIGLARGKERGAEDDESDDGVGGPPPTRKRPRG